MANMTWAGAAPTWDEVLKYYNSTLPTSFKTTDFGMGPDISYGTGDQGANQVLKGSYGFVNPQIQNNIDPNNLWISQAENGTDPGYLTAKVNKDTGAIFKLVPDASGNLVPQFQNFGPMQTNSNMFTDIASDPLALAMLGGVATLGTMGVLGAGAGATAGAAPIEVDGLLGMGSGAGDLAGVVGGASTAALPTLGQVVNTGKTVGTAAGAVNSINNLVNPPSGSLSSGGSNVTNPSTGIGSDITNLLSLFGPLAGTYFANQSRNDLGDKLMELYKGEAARVAPWEQKLKESYDNPQAVFTSPEFTSGRDLYKSALDRKASASGTLSNPIARQQLLDKYGATYMNNYRQGINNTLEGMVRNASNYKDLAAAGLVNTHADAGAWAETFGKLFGNNKGSYDPQSFGAKLDTFMKSGGNIYDFFRNMGNPSSVPAVTNPNYEPGGSSIGFPTWGGGSTDMPTPVDMGGWDSGNTGDYWDLGSFLP